MSYFEEMGKILAAEMCRDPANRQRIRGIADQALARHVSGPMARDAAPPIAGQVRQGSPRYSRDEDPEEGLDPRGGEEYGGEGEGDPNGGEGPLSASECVSALQLMLQRLSGPDRVQLIGALHQILSEEPADGNAGAVNGAALDRGIRSGRRTGRDRAAMDAQFRAQAANTKSFIERYPGAALINTGGRY